MTKRVALAAGVLLIGLLIAAVGATTALRLISSETSGPGGSRPLSEADVRRSFAQAPAGQAAPSGPAATPAPGQRHSPGSRTSGSQHAPVPHTTIGGTVFAACAAGKVKLTNWIPQSGYSSDGYSPGPAASAWVIFKSSATELTVTATCVGGKPRFVTTTDNRGGGHGGHDGGGGGGGGSGH